MQRHDIASTLIRRCLNVACRWDAIFRENNPASFWQLFYTYTTERKGNTKNLHINVLYFVYFILFA